MFQSAVLAPSANVHGLVNQAVVQKLYQAHQRGIGRHGNVLWSLLVLARWAERYLRSRNASMQPCGHS
jgi:hypothetical protein